MFGQLQLAEHTVLNEVPVNRRIPLLSLVKIGHFASIAAMLLRAVAGIGLVAGIVGGGGLLLLARRESYAYEIASTLAAAVGMGEGTIYPLMRRMQDDGLVETRLVESNSGPPRKYYRLTPSGRAAFTTQKREWRSFAEAVTQLLGER